MVENRQVSFLVFFIMWAQLQGWDVPALHVRICIWLEHCLDPERILMVFRGAAKSTIYAVYKAWKLYRNPHHRSLVWSADGPTAGMLTADVINVLRNHPLTRGMLPQRPGAKRFWVNGAKDARNASMRAVGVNSNATGARADDIDYDDVEVPGNIETAEARKKLRDRISEATHIAVPGSQKTMIGTPHHNESIYPERIEAGAAVLKIPLFEHSVRYTETSQKTRYRFDKPVGTDGIYVMVGIHKYARLLVENVDFRYDGTEIVFAKPPGVTFDVCSMCAWPERFNRKEIEIRRKETRTFNAWDSQYQLEAKPLEEMRLDPDRMIPYDVKPVLKSINRTPVMMLGNVQIVGARCRWDCAIGKVTSDASALSLILTDAVGNLYWQFAVDVGEGSDGDLDMQCLAVKKLVIEYGIPHVTVETNGPGGFVVKTLRKHLLGTGCAVNDDYASTNKNKDILDAFEAPLNTGFLWAHVDVINGPAGKQMRDFNPADKDQDDDFLDSGARAIKETPVRIGRIVGNLTGQKPQNWAPNHGVHEAVFEDS